MARADCPIDSCTAGRKDNQLMCRDHWRMVPRDLAQRVYAAAKKMWADHTEESYEAWSEVRDQAVHAVEEKLGEKSDA